MTIDEAILLTSEALKGKKLEKHELVTVIKALLDYLERMK